MKKLLFISALLVVNIFASDVWFQHAPVALKYAKKYEVPILVFVYKNGCSYCEKSISNFEYPPLKQVLTNHSILPIAVNEKIT